MKTVAVATVSWWLALLLSMRTATVLASIPAECLPRASMGKTECQALNTYWLQPGSKCAPVRGDDAKPLSPLVAWVGRGCAAPCLKQARRLRVRPAAYCASRPGQPAPYVDGTGGCKRFTECGSLTCRPSCTRHPWCSWDASTGTCVSDYAACMVPVQKFGAACQACFGPTRVVKTKGVDYVSGRTCCDSPLACFFCVAENHARAKKCRA